MQRSSALLVTLTIYLCYTQITASLENKDDVTFPPAWLEKCKDGDVLFKERAKAFENCYSKLLNISTFGDSFGKALENNNVTSFIRHQCMKVPQLHECLDEYAKSVEHCFNDEEQTDMRTTVNAMKALVRFVCYRDGERVSIFLKDDGMLCFSEQHLQLLECINNTTKEEFTNVTTPDDLGFLVAFNYSPTTCRNIDDLYKCMFDSLTKCNERTPSLLFEALTKAVLKETPCKWETANRSASTEFANYLLLLLAAVIVV